MEANALNHCVAQKRDSSAELYRIALTFGICFLHSITNGGYNTPWFSNIFLSCVNGFAFITGYYGVPFKPSKVIRLFATSIFIGLIVYGAGCWAGLYPLPALTVEVIKLLRSILLESWFITAYAVLLLVAPMIDGILKWVPRHALPVVLLPFFLLAFGWSFGLSFPIICGAFPHMPGLGDYTGLSLITTYTCARLINEFKIETYFTRKRLLIACVILWGITSLGVGGYASPFAIALAATTFYLFKGLSLPKWAEKTVHLLSPSTLAIFLLHTSLVGFTFIKYAETTLVDHHVPLLFVYLLTALTIFTACLLIDIPRRLLLHLTRHPTKTLLNKIDTTWTHIVTTLSTRLAP